MKITTMTISVNRIASWRVGQDTLRNSPTVSWKNLWMLCQNSLENIHLLASRSNIRHGNPPVMVKTPPLLDGVIRKSLILFLLGRPGRNRTHNPRFWRAVLCQIELLAYVGAGFRRPYFVSRCSVCLRQRGQYLFNSIRPGSLRLFFSVV